MKLTDMASVIRSKNAGPYELTFDIIFRDAGLFRAAADSGCISAEKIATLYGISTADVLGIVHFAPANAIKITIRRPIPSGALGETDVYGAQQHGPLLLLEI